MVKTLAIGVVVAMLVGCYGDLPEGGVILEENEPAIQAALSAAGSRDPGNHPPVYWMFGDALDCRGGAGFTDPELGCVGGITVARGGKTVGSWVSIQPGQVRHSQFNTLCHEMRHIVHGDTDHKTYGKLYGSLYETDLECMNFLYGMPELDKLVLP